MLSRRRSNPQPTLLERYWTALRRGGATTLPDGLDADLANLAQRLSADVERLNPPGAVVAELRERLIASATSSNNHRAHAWSGPAVDPAQKRRTARAIKESEERVIMSEITTTQREPVPIQQRRWVREALKIAAAIAVFAVIGGLLVLLLRDNGDKQPSVAVPVPTTTEAATLASPTAGGTATIDPTRQAAQAHLTATTATGKTATAAAADSTATANAALPVPGEVVGRITVGNKPLLLAATDGAIWVPNGEDGTVSRIDPSTNTVIATIPIGKTGTIVGSPQFVVVYNGQVWVTNDAEGSLVRIDPATNQVVQTLSLPDSFDPYGILADETGFWISSDWGTNQRVVHIDPQSGAVLGEIPISEPLTIASAFGSIWVVEHGKDQIVRIDPATYSVVATIPVSGNPAPAVIVAGDDAIWVTQQSLGSVARIDPATNEVVATIDTGLPWAGGIVVADSGVWVTDNSGNSAGVVRIDPTTNRASATIEQNSADAVGIIESDGSIWVAEISTNQVVRIDPTP